MLTTVEKIKVIMKRNNFTMTELANQLNCSRQNLSNKMSRNNFDERELTGLRKKLCKQYLTKLDKAKITGISLI